MKRRNGIALALAAAILLSGAPALALVRTIPMSRFKPTSPDQPYYQTPQSIKVFPSVAGSYGGWAPVKLPVGATIEKVTYYRWVESPGNTSCTLYRVKPTEVHDMLAIAYTNAAVTDGYLPEDLGILPQADLVVRRGYIYYVHVTMYRGGGVAGVKIQYRPAAP